MKYKLTVIKYENNENYEAEMAKWKSDREDNYKFPKYRQTDYPEDYGKPTLELSTRSLEVFLTEEEYKKVKGEVIKIFE